jgi:hypothetical protein
VPSAVFTATPLLVGSVRVGVDALAGAVIVNLPEAVLLAKAIVPVDVPGMPSTGAMVYAGAAAPVVLLPNTVPPAALLSAKVRAGVVVAVATFVVKSGLSDPALKEVTVPVPAGKSAATSARKVGVAAMPVAGPANMVLAVCAMRDSVTAPTDSALLYTTESPENDVTPPAAGIGTYAEMFPLASNWKVASCSPGGATGSVELRFGAVTRVPLTDMEEPAAYAASINRKFSASTSSCPKRASPSCEVYLCSGYPNNDMVTSFRVLVFSSFDVSLYTMLLFSTTQGCP